eukprot:3795075-Rhodomonas_salina.1
MGPNPLNKQRILVLRTLRFVLSAAARQSTNTISIHRVQSEKSEQGYPGTEYLGYRVRSGRRACAAPGTNFSGSPLQHPGKMSKQWPPGQAQGFDTHA